MNFCLKKYYKFTSLSVLFVFGIFFSFSLPTSHAAEIIISYNCEKVIGKTGTVFEGKKGVCADSVKPSGYCTDGGALSESDKYVQYKNLECSGFNTTYCCVPEEYDDSALSNHIKKSECESYADGSCEISLECSSDAHDSGKSCLEGGLCCTSDDTKKPPIDDPPPSAISANLDYTPLEAIPGTSKTDSKSFPDFIQALYKFVMRLSDFLLLSLRGYSSLLLILIW